MVVHCDVILNTSATPAQLTAVGRAVWMWCLGASGEHGMYPRLDNRTLVDLIAGEFPALERPAGSGERGFHFSIEDDLSLDREATIDSLRRTLPAQGIEDILVAGKSWKLAA
jgi:hypothetical protein